MKDADPDDLYPGAVSPPPRDWRSFAWGGGVFQAGRRPYTDVVEGVLASPDPILMVTLRGGAERHELSTSDGLRYDGPDRSGSVSFLPGGCERRLRVRGVAWHWASISLHLDAPALSRVRAFSNVADPVLHGLLAELDRLHEADGGLDLTYCDTVGGMLSAYLSRKFGAARPDSSKPGLRLTAWQLRRIGDYVSAHLDRSIRIATLAGLVGLSEGHLHRAFRATTGETPLRFVNRHRTERAIALMRGGTNSVLDLAASVGFTSPSAFARVFRSVTGVSPSDYRTRLDLD